MIENKFIINLINNSKADNLEYATEYIQVIGFLIERHVQDRYNDKDYQVLLPENIATSVLTDYEVDTLKHFLFFILLNYPDRTHAAAVALGRCYDGLIQEALCQCIELYRWKDEILTTKLIKAITDENDDINKLNIRILDLFRDIIKQGPPDCKEFLLQRFEHDLDNYILK